MLFCGIYNLYLVFPVFNFAQLTISVERNLSCRSCDGDLIYQKRTPCCFHKHTLGVEHDKDVAKLHILRKFVLLEIHEGQGCKRNEHTKSHAHDHSNTGQIYVPKVEASNSKQYLRSRGTTWPTLDGEVLSPSTQFFHHFSTRSSSH